MVNSPFRALRLVLLTLTLFAAGLSCSAATTGWNAPPQTRQLENAMQATVVLVDTQRTLILCAAEYIAPNAIATAEHCLPRATGCGPDDGEYCPIDREVSWVQYSNWAGIVETEFQQGYVYWLDRDNDLAVIRTVEASDYWVSVRDHGAFIGEPVTAIGHPLGVAYTISTGYVNVPSVKDPEGGSFLRASIDINKGSSGGGLYDIDGRLLGVTSSLAAGGKVGYFGHARLLLPVLDELGMSEVDVGTPTCDGGDAGSCRLPPEGA